MKIYFAVDFFAEILCNLQIPERVFLNRQHAFTDTRLIILAFKVFRFWKLATLEITKRM